MNSGSPSRASIVAAVCGSILIAAAILRFLELDLVSITSDEGIHGLFAMNIAIFRNWPLVGLPSVGIRNSAAFLYLLALPYAVARHPLAGVAFIAGLNVLSVGLAMRMTWRLFGPSAAVVSGLWFAFAPWMVLYARNMWPPSCVPLLAVLITGAGLRWLEEGGSRRLFLLILAGFLAPQIHFSAFVAPVWLAVVFVVGWRRLRFPPVAAGILLGLATWGPWLYFQFVELGGEELGRLANTAGGNLSGTQVLVRSAQNFKHLLGAGGFDYWFGVDPATQDDLFPRWLIKACVLGEWAAAAAAASAIVWAVIRRDRASRLLALWCVLPFAMLLLVRPAAHPHYVLVAFPVPYILVGAMLGRWIERGREGSPLRAMGVLLPAAALAGLHLAFLGGWLEYLRQGRTDGRGHFELTYRQRRAAVLSILEHSPDRQVLLAGHFSGNAPAYDWIYNFEQIRLGYAALPRDDRRRYWVDEETGVSPPPTPGFHAVDSWRVGPTRIVLLERDAARPP